MNLVQSQPKFTIQVTKATFVVVPVAVEINRAVQSLLEHSPSSTVRCLVTKYIKGRQLIRFNGVNTISWFTRGFVDFCAVSFD